MKAFPRAASAPTSAFGSRTLASAAYPLVVGESVVTGRAPPPGKPVPTRPSLRIPGIQTKASGLQRSLQEQPAGGAVGGAGGVAATGLGPGRASSPTRPPGHTAPSL